MASEAPSEFRKDKTLTNGDMLRGFVASGVLWQCKCTRRSSLRLALSTIEEITQTTRSAKASASTRLAR